jgi:hypothetical protein
MPPVTNQVKIGQRCKQQQAHYGEYTTSRNTLAFLLKRSTSGGNKTTARKGRRVGRYLRYDPREVIEWFTRLDDIS